MAAVVGAEPNEQITIPHFLLEAQVGQAAVAMVVIHQPTQETLGM